MSSNSDVLRYATRAKELQLELEQVRRNWHACREANMQSLETITMLKELLAAATARMEPPADASWLEMEPQRNRRRWWRRRGQVAPDETQVAGGA